MAAAAEVEIDNGSEMRCGRWHYAYTCGGKKVRCGKTKNEEAKKNDWGVCTVGHNDMDNDDEEI